jgi:signal transduction histidine kinase
MSEARTSDTGALLRSFPLFEELSDEQLAWLAGRVEEISVPAGTRLFEVGDPAKGFFVLIDGELELRHRIDNHERVAVRGSTPGVWAGAIPIIDDAYAVSARASKNSRLFRLEDRDMRDMLTNGFPIARHLLMGVRAGTASFLYQVQEHQKLTALGKMAAGLAHELNNPASAARRSAGELRRVLDEQDVAWLALTALPDQRWRDGLDGLIADLKARQSAPMPSGMERSDREESVGSWLGDHGISDPWELAPSLVDAGVDVAWLEEQAAGRPADVLEPLLRWVMSRASASRLVEEVEHSAGRISELVQAVKDYSYMDRGAVQDVDVRLGIQSTLTMLRHRLRGIEVERNDDPQLPLVCAAGSRLNQVWTNLLDNAVDAVEAAHPAGVGGRIRIDTLAEGEEVVVQVTDNGPGIPPEVQSRVFEPFFTTKAPGEGTGLGLETSYRIVVNDHMGAMSVSSEPGRTTFTVRLPTRPAGKT